MRVAWVMFPALLFAACGGGGPETDGGADAGADATVDSGGDARADAMMADGATPDSSVTSDGGADAGTPGSRLARLAAVNDWAYFIQAPRTSEAAKPTSDAMEQGYDGRLDMVDEGATKPSSPALRVDEPPREPPERAGTHGAEHTPVQERTPGTQLDADGMIQTAKSSSS